MALLAACSSDLQTSTLDPAEEPLLSTQATTVTRVVPNSASDAEEQSTGSYYNNSTVLELGEKTPGDIQQTGLRFSSVAIPANANITSAKLEFVAVTNQSGTASLTVRGDKEANAPEFTSSYSRISARPRTTAVTNWAPSAWTSGNTYSTVDFRAVAQELVNQSSWTSGNAMAFIIAGTGLRKAVSYDQSSTLAPKLYVTYEIAASISTCLTSSTPRTYTTTQNLNIQGLSSNAQVTLKGKTINGGSSSAVTIKNNSDGLCVSGGTLKTDAQDGSSWDGVFHSGRLFVNLYNSKKATVERVAGDTAGDGFHIASKVFSDPPLNGSLHAENWTLSQSYFRHVGDDIVDNDMRAAGTVDDVLVDWAHTGIACRGYAQGFQRVPGKMTVKNTLFAIKPQLSAARGANMYYSPFKWDTPDGLQEGSRVEYRKPCPLALNNVTVYMAPKPSGASEMAVFATYAGGSIDPVEFVTECTNVTFLYGGTNYGKKSDGTPLEQLKQLERLQARWGANCFKIIQGQAAKNEWNARREAWFVQHNLPGFEHIQYYRNRQPSAP